MKKNLTKVLLLVILSTTISFSFTNCGDSFKTLVSPEQIAHEALTMKNEVYINGNQDNMFYAGRDLVFSADIDNPEPGATLEWSYTINNLPQGCNILSVPVPSLFKINCPTAVGQLKVFLKVNSVTGSLVADPVSYNLTQAPGGGTPPSTDVPFTILAGTGNGSWNTVDNPIRARIGQRIVITNADTVPHRMHTGGSPCPHGANILPGQTGVCVVGSAFNGSVYDHNTGTNSKIYIVTTP